MCMGVCVRVHTHTHKMSFFLVSSRRAGSNDLFCHYTGYYFYNAHTICSQLLSPVNIRHEGNVTEHLMG